MQRSLVLLALIAPLLAASCGGDGAEVASTPTQTAPVALSTVTADIVNFTH